MKKINPCLFSCILVILLIARPSYAQDIEFSKEDTLKKYKLLFNSCIADTVQHNKYIHQFEKLTKTLKDKNLLFYAYAALAEGYRIKGNYEFTIKNLFYALEYSDYADSPKDIATIYDDLVVIYQNKGETERMFTFYNKSIEIKESIGDIEGIHKSKSRLIIYYRHTGNYIEAFRIGFDALDYFEEHKDTSDILLAYHNISMIYKSLGNYQKALEIYDNVTQYLNESKFIKEQSTIYNGIGTIQLKMGNYQDALGNFLKSLELENNVGENKFRKLTRLNNIGLTYCYLGNFEPAISNIRICIQEYSKAERWNDLANMYNSLGICYEEMNLPDSSIYYYLKSLELCEKYSFKELQIKSALWVSRLYNNIGKSDSAYTFLNKYYELLETIDRTNLTWEITAEELEYMRRKDQRLKEVERRNNILIILIVASFMVLSILASWIIVIKQKIKIQKSIAAKKELEKNEIELKDEINIQNKELVSKILQLSDSNSVIKVTIQKLMKLKAEMGVNSKQKIQQVINDLEHSVNDTIWNEFEYRFVKVHPLLYKKLSASYPNLTISERRLCALIHLNFSSKEIAHITKQSQKSILVAKSRLRSKLNIDESIKMTDFLQELTRV